MGYFYSLISHYIARYRKYIISISLIYLIGFIIGMLLPNFLSVGILGELNTFIGEVILFLPNANQDALTCAINLFTANVGIIFIMYIAGFFVFGVPIIALIILYEALTLGLLVSLLFSTQASIAMIILLLGILPHQIFIVISLITGAAISMDFSFILANGANIWGRPLIYFTIKTLIVCVFILFASFIGGTISIKLLESFFALI